MITALQHQRITRRQPLLRYDRQPEGREKPSVRITRIETLLIGLLAASIVFSLLVKNGLSHRIPPAISFPGPAEADRILFDFLIPEEMEVNTSSGMGSEVLHSLKLRTYEIKNGDTLSEIAQRYHLNLDTIISYNDVRDARTLRPGTVLELPNTNGLKYRVRRGDYLGAIAGRYGVPLNSILDWNRLESSVIKPGQELFIPAARLSEMELNRVLGRLFIYPTRGRITSRFGMRKDPFIGIRRFHNGVDLANDVGTPVVAAMSGRVAMVGYNAHYGKYIILTHPEGFQTLYGHLHSFRVSKGGRVRQGQVIAEMGNSGYSTGPHLHFSIFRRGEPVDPFRYLH